MLRFKVTFEVFVFKVAPVAEPVMLLPEAVHVALPPLCAVYSHVAVNPVTEVVSAVAALAVMVKAASMLTIITNASAHAPHRRINVFIVVIFLSLIRFSSIHVPIHIGT